ncbi:secreted RxLR effector protein 161-like [Arachis hypogaea]|uniref:secreted RxLR effector protein 161-like n=1 Tax=Arachis hypogaea TaxID=3818 RepID=UPI003B20FE9C
MGTPMHPNIKLDKDEHTRNVDETRYRKMIGFLMYITSSRPDIIQSYSKIDSFQLVGYCNVDFVGDKVDRRTTSGIYYILGKSLNIWSSKKQATVAMSTAKAEYIAASSYCSQLLRLNTQNYVEEIEAGCTTTDNEDEDKDSDDSNFDA